MTKEHFIDTRKLRRYKDLLIIDHEDKMEYIPISQIVYCERSKLTTRIHMVQPVYLVANADLQEIVELIDDRSFARLNNMHYINKKYIANYQEDKHLITTILNQKIPYTPAIKSEPLKTR
ncbi:MAG: LytTR family transcriptional regulator DNA-binding domain-containing protein [Bacteroidales bacterium]|nr:LytTR family transcriptional regulator DNA-binding domain-containing protein [Bacteroidales bacterium]